MLSRKKHERDVRFLRLVNRGLPSLGVGNFGEVPVVIALHLEVEDLESSMKREN